MNEVIWIFTNEEILKKKCMVADTTRHNFAFIHNNLPRSLIIENGVAKYPDGVPMDYKPLKIAIEMAKEKHAKAFGA